MKQLINFKWLILLSATVAFLFHSQTVSAQQDPMYTQYMFNTMSVNPAYAGSKEDFNLIFLNRRQWVGFEGAPITQTITVHGPINFKGQHMGIGLSYVHDKIGPLNTNNVFLDFAYRIKVHEGGYLSMGAKAGIEVRKNGLTTLDPVDMQDPAYVQDITSNITPNFGAGLFYFTDKYYLGVSTPKLSKADLSDGNAALYEEQTERHYFIIGGYVWDLNQDFKFKPAFLTKLVKGAPASVDLTASMMYRNRLIGGVSYRFGDSFGAQVQARVFRRVWLGYAYDFTVSDLGSYNNGTHEIMINIDFGLPQGEVIKSPRFF